MYGCFTRSCLLLSAESDDGELLSDQELRDALPSGTIGALHEPWWTQYPEQDNFWLSAHLVVSYIPIGIMSIEITATSAAELGAVLREARRLRGLRLEDVAAGAGVGVRFLSELERGKPTVRLEETLRVVSALGLRLSIEDPGG